jgi:hypothetical protein
LLFSTFGADTAAKAEPMFSGEIAAVPLNAGNYPILFVVVQVREKKVSGETVTVLFFFICLFSSYV